MKCLNKIFSVRNSDDKTHKILTISGFKIKFKRGKNYSLNSGERQTGIIISEIRTDHVNRYKFAIEIIKKYSLSQKNLKILDIFCGNGYGAWLIAKNTEAEITAIDGSKEAILCAKKYYSSPQISHSQKLFPFTLKKNFYDFIVSLESIEHIKNDTLFLKTLYKAMKPNSYLIISTPNMEKQDLNLNKNHFHYRHYYNHEFINFAENIGFKFIEMYGQDVFIFNENKIMTGTLKLEEMTLKANHNGQFSVFILKK